MLQKLLAPWKKDASGSVFINYRRSDTQWFAGRLADSLADYFGDERVFRDIEDIQGGADFSDVIHGTLGKTDAAIVLIGNNWLDATDSDGHKRLLQPEDWVGREIVAALEAKIPIYPVLVEDTPMPRANELPEWLQPLLRFNGISVSDKRWDNDVARLARIVGLDIPSQTERKLNGLSLLVSLSLMLTLLVPCLLLIGRLMCQVAGTDSKYAELFSTACNAIGIGSGKTQMLLLSLSESGIPYIAIACGSVLLFVFARLIDPSRRHWFLGAAWAGAIGTTSAFILFEPNTRPL